MYCRKCGKELQNETSYCPACGEKITKDEKPINGKKSVFNRKTVIICVVVLSVIAALTIFGFLFKLLPNNKDTELQVSSEADYGIGAGENNDSIEMTEELVEGNSPYNISDRQVPLLVDNADLLNEAEEQELEKELDDVSDRKRCDIVIVTVESLDGKSPQDYADDYYDDNGYGYGSTSDGILLLIDMDRRVWHMSTCGTAISIFTDDVLDAMADSFMPYLSDDEFVSAFKKYIELCEENITNWERDKDSEVSNSEISDGTREALNAYNSLLTNGPFKKIRGDRFIDLSNPEEEIWYPEHCMFNVVYIDDDEIPELIVTNYVDSSHATGYGQLYSYMDGAIYTISTLSSPTSVIVGETLGYYSKSGWYEESYMWQGYGTIDTNCLSQDVYTGFRKKYEPDSSGNISLTQYQIHYGHDYNDRSKEEYDRELKEQVDDYVIYEYYENTEENRRKILL